MWEYKIVTLLGNDEVTLNELGAQGWELVSVTTETEDTYPVAYLKRPKFGV